MDLFRMSERLNKDEEEFAMSWFCHLMGKKIPALILERKTCIEVWREGRCAFGNRETPKGKVTYSYEIPEEFVEAIERRAHVGSDTAAPAAGSSKAVFNFA